MEEELIELERRIACLEEKVEVLRDAGETMLDSMIKLTIEKIEREKGGRK